MPTEVKARGDIAAAITMVATGPASALVAIEDPLVISNARQIAGFALQNRLPLIGFKPQAEAGALMEYGADVRELFYRSAGFVYNILKGTSPGDLPIERAVKFELVEPEERQGTRRHRSANSNRQRRRGDRMRRREFITLLGGAAVAWPLRASAQQPKMLRVGYSGILPRGAPHYEAFERRMAETRLSAGSKFFI